MDALGAGRRLWRRRLWVLAALLLSAGLVFALTQRKTGAGTSAASAALLVDSSQSLLTNLDPKIPSLAERAVAIANVGQGEAIEHRIEALAGLAPGATSVLAATPVLGGGPAAAPPPPSFSRRRRTTVTYLADGLSPVISITAQGPAGDTAVRLAKAAQQALIEYTQSQSQAEQKALTQAAGATRQRRPQAAVAPADTIMLRVLRSATGGTIRPHPSSGKAAVFGGGLFVVLCLAILLGDNLRSGRLARQPLGRRRDGGEQGASSTQVEPKRSQPVPSTTRSSDGEHSGAPASQTAAPRWRCSALGARIRTYADPERAAPIGGGLVVSFCLAFLLWDTLHSRRASRWSTGRGRETVAEHRPEGNMHRAALRSGSAQGELR